MPNFIGRALRRLPEARPGLFSRRAVAIKGSPVSPASLPLPANLQEQLDALNGLERACDRHERLFRDYRWELYALWHRWTDAANRSDSDSQTELKGNLDTLEKFVKDYQGVLDQTRKNRDSAKTDLGAKLEVLSRAPSAVIYSLAEEPLAPFYAPKDPVLLLTGPAAQAKGTRVRPATVAVRVTGEELRSFGYDLDQRPNQTFAVTDEWLKAQGISSAYLQPRCHRGPRDFLKKPCFWMKWKTTHGWGIQEIPQGTRETRRAAGSARSFRPLRLAAQPVDSALPLLGSCVAAR